MALKKGDNLRTAFRQYVVEAQIGQGGAGTVYKVSLGNRASYAAKVLASATAGPTRLERFKHEIQFCMSAPHRSIVPVLEYGTTDHGESFYVMPLLSGTLRSRLKQGFQPNQVLPGWTQILDAVEAAHLRGVWHRDLKPENVLFDANADAYLVADFGVAHFEEEELFTAVETRSDERLASFRYSAPEQRIRGERVSSSADIFALGLILHEMFTGIVPQGTGFRKVSDVAPEFSYLDEVVNLMILYDAGQRPSVQQVKQMLISKGNESVSLQRLNQLKTEVIPETEVDDPVIRNPIRLLSVDYRGDQLFLKVSAVPPGAWINRFRNPKRSYTYIGNTSPVNFGFTGDTAAVQTHSGYNLQTVVDNFKSYIEAANIAYKEDVLTEHAQGLERMRRELKEKAIAEEKRVSILKSLKI